ncbi:MAG: N-acetylmuramoyl-L-alanine amidase [Verrucomicrobia bacterium]|nr:MAG: N-acetylmuramoyl-L-alanine amidase [Verrucomicrobiota bacterium]
MFPNHLRRKNPDRGRFREWGDVLLLLLLLTHLVGCDTVRKPAVDLTVEKTGLVRSDRLADLLGLSERWVVAGSRLAMDGAAGHLEIESGRREANARGVRLFLGEPVTVANGHLYVSRTDMESLLMPIFKGTGAKGAGPIRTIAVDAGHGGRDNGTMNRELGLNEKNLTLDVAKRLRDALRRRGYVVIMTRTGDEFVPLEQRPKRAHGADLFISIHFNATGNSRSSGSETYVLSPAGQASTGTSLPTTGDMTFVPGNRWDAPSAAFGFIVQSGLLKELGTVDRGLKHARFAVLRDLPCPGVLVESAFLSNHAEATRVASEAFRSRLAENLAGSVEAFAKLAGEGLP